MIVDNFAGGGGASTGIELALGRCVDIAVNHDREAVAMHAVNHPQTRHFCEDVFKVDPVEVTKGRPVGLAWFSPDCKHFSKAKGGKPKSKKIRGLAWVMVKWAATVAPRVMMLENVEEFKTWGPLLADGSACPARKGKTFRNFVKQLENLGYQVETRELRACDYGAPTIRRRLFLIARRDGMPIVWPEPTHGAPTSEGVKFGRLLPWRTAAECIDWSIPCRSIFERERPLAEATMRRIARGIQRYVIDAADPFIIRTDMQSAAARNGIAPVEEPIRTITSTGGFGVAVPHVTKFRTGSTGADMRDPLATITAGPKENPAGAPHALGLVTTFLTEHANASGQRNFPADEPLRTQCGEVKGGHFALVAPSLLVNTSGHPGGPVTSPHHTVCAEGTHHALVGAFLAKHYGGHETPGSDLRRPVDTVTATDHNAVVAAHVVRPFGQSVGSGVEEPVGTVTPGGLGKVALATSHLVKQYGTTTGQDDREPMATVTGGGNHIGEVRALLIKYYSEGGQDQSVRDPMHTIPTKDRIGLVTVAGEEYAIADIGMRMLEPHELYAAQGFPKSYIINPVIDGRPLPKYAQVRMCGNSVCPPLAKALVEANVPELSAWEKDERRAA